MPEESESSGLHHDRLLLMGQACMSAGELPTAQKALLEAVRNRPDDPASHRLLVEVLLRRGDAERASRVLRRLEQIAPGHDSLAALRAQVARAEGTVSSPRGVVREVAPVASQTVPDEVHRRAATGGDLIAVAQQHETASATKLPSAVCWGVCGLAVIVAAGIWLGTRWSSQSASQWDPPPASVAAASKQGVGPSNLKSKSERGADGSNLETTSERAADGSKRAAKSERDANPIHVVSASEHGTNPANSGTMPVDAALSTANARRDAEIGRDLRAAHKDTKTIFAAALRSLQADDRIGAATLLREVVAKPDSPASAYFYLGEALSSRNSPAARDAYLAYLSRVSDGPLAARARRAIGR